MTRPDTEAMVLQAISRITHRPVHTLNAGLSLRQDLSLDSLNALELEFELKQAGFPDIELEGLMIGTSIGDIIKLLEAGR